MAEEPKLAAVDMGTCPGLFVAGDHAMVKMAIQFVDTTVTTDHDLKLKAAMLTVREFLEDHVEIGPKSVIK